MNKGIFDMKLYNLSKVYNENNEIDPTLVKATFIILEVNSVSGNDQVITKEEALKMSGTMKLKPLTCQYFSTTDYNNPNDHFGSHGVYKEKFRKGGQEFLATNSFAIGVSEDGCRLETIDKDGVQIEVLVCDYVLWMARYPNIVSLIDEMYQNNIELYSSCEYLYSNYEVKDDITYPKDLIFDGHCLLGQKPDGTKVNPAFEVSKLKILNEKWNKEVSEVLNKETNSKEVEELKTIEELLKMYCEMSHEDVRSKLYKALSETLTASEFNGIWISHYDIFGTYFLYELWNSEEEKYDYYKVNFTKNEDDTLTVDVEGKEKVERKTVWVTVNELETVVNEKEEIIKTLNEDLSNLKTDKEGLQVKFNEVSEKVITLNAKVEELQPIVNEYNSEKYEKSLNEKMDYYKAKFISLNAKEQFETEETQELVKKSLNDMESTLKLNTMLVDLVKVEKINEEPKKVKEINSKIENLIPQQRKSVEEKYGF